MSHEDIEATKAPLIDHLIELRSRLIKALIAFAIMFVLCFIFAKQIYNILVWPFVFVAGPENSRFIYTALLEYFVTQLKLAMFGAAFLAFPVIAKTSKAAPFGFFALMMVVQFITVLVWYPETKGMSLEMLQHELNKGQVAH